MRQGLPKLCDPCIGDFVLAELEPFETREPLQVGQPGVGHLGVVEGEELEIAQSPEVGQPGVGHRESGTVQLFEVLEPTDVRRAT